LRTRNFSLMCAARDGQVTSNLLLVELSIIHEDHAAQAVGQVDISKQGVAQVFEPIKSMNKYEPGQLATNVDKQASGAGMAVIAVVCVGFIMFMIIVGVMRIRSAHHRSVEVNVEERQEMEWDNSALNIIVNPMDRETVYDETEMNGLHGDETDTDDDIGSFHDDGPDTSDEEQDKEKDDKGLEWDSTTATY